MWPSMYRNTLNPMEFNSVEFLISRQAFRSMLCQYSPSQNITALKSGRWKSGMHTPGITYCSSNLMPFLVRASAMSLSILVCLFAWFLRWSMPLHRRLHVVDASASALHDLVKLFSQTGQDSVTGPPFQFFALSPVLALYPHGREQNLCLLLGLATLKEAPHSGHCRDVLSVPRRASLNFLFVLSLILRPLMDAACREIHSGVRGTCFLQCLASFLASIAVQPGCAQGCFGLGIRLVISIKSEYPHVTTKERKNV